jgi:hypothetical protein
MARTIRLEPRPRPGVWQDDVAGGGGAAQQVRAGEPARRIGEVAQRLGAALDRPQAGDVGERDRQRHPPPRHPQHPHEPAGVVLGRSLAAQIRQ